MPLESNKLLSDMLEAANSIAEFAAGKSLTDFQNDKLLRSAIYHQFIVIGEALSQLRSLDEALVAKISEHPRIIAFRNQVIHGYAKIDDEISWRIIQDKLPILRQELELLVAS